MTFSSWTCAQCGILVPWNNTHTCSTVTIPGPLPTYSAGPRKYRIHGTISPQDRMGKFYDVDLVVEVLS
jgi:hypothetical protein